MTLQKFRWSRVYESAEEELLDFLKAKNIEADRLVGEEFEPSEPRNPEQDSTIWCAEGSLNIKFDHKTFSIQPGDAIHIPAGNKYQAVAGISGYVC